MNRGPHLLVKIFRQKEHRDDFLNGSLYMNSVSFFKNFVEEEKNNVADKHEGAYRFEQPHELKMTVDGVTVDPSKLVGPIVFNIEWIDYLNIFCLTHMHPHGITDKPTFDKIDFEVMKEYFKLPNESYGLGEYAVIINNIDEFLSRIEKILIKLRLENKILDYCAKDVIYYNENSASFRHDEYSLDSVFMKSSRYSHQSEFRIVVESAEYNNEAIRIDVGDISDISWVCLTKQVNEYLSLKPIIDNDIFSID